MPVGPKLWIAVVVANVIGLTVAVFVANAIRAVPETEGTETALRFAYYGMMLVVAAAEALWMDEVFFKGAFRITHLRGKTADVARKRGDVGTMAATMQRSTATFPFSVLVCSVLTYILFNVVNHDFDHYYKWVGQHASALRGDDEASNQRRFDAIDALSARREKEVLPHLLMALEREDAVAPWAAWAIGRHRDVKQTRVLIRPLVAAYRRGDPALERESMIALARLQHRSFAPNVQEALASELDAGGEIDARLVWALGYLQHTSSFPVLERALYHQDQDIARAAAWAISQHRDQKGGRKAVEVLENRLPSAPFYVRCALVHSLGITASEGSNVALAEAFERTSIEDHATVCPSLQLEVRPDHAGDRQDLLMPTEIYAMKTLESMGQMRATTPEIRKRIEPFLDEVIADDRHTQATREAAGSLLSGIQDQRDDAANPRLYE
jgi:hypothetical protein